eukprot:6928962-Pyramimonas_sp.AAC.1
MLIRHSTAYFEPCASVATPAVVEAKCQVCDARAHYFQTSACTRSTRELHAVCLGRFQVEPGGLAPPPFGNSLAPPQRARG